MDVQKPGLEREIKLRLSGPADYIAIAGVLPVPRRWGMQLNVYLDTADGRLKAAHVSLRVRVTPDHARLTMKTPSRMRDSADDETGAFVHDETEVPLDRAVAVTWISAPGAARPRDVPGFGLIGTLAGGQPLIVPTWSITRRAVCDTAWGVTLELDETVFPDGFRDFEIEAENLDSRYALHVIEIHAAAAGIRLWRQDSSKQARARAHRGDMKWVVPCGAPTSALVPFFETDAPVSAFCLKPVEFTGLVQE